MVESIFLPETLEWFVDRLNQVVPDPANMEPWHVKLHALEWFGLDYPAQVRLLDHLIETGQLLLQSGRLAIHRQQRVDLQEIPLLSYFKFPIVRKPPLTPIRSINLLELYVEIAGSTYQAITQRANQLYQEYKATGDKKNYSAFKRKSLDYVTFCGTFSSKEDAGLLRHSGYVCFDLDHVPDLQELKAALLDDPYFETQLLFTSPGGNGLKWIISLEGHRPAGQHPPSRWFSQVKNHILVTYKIKADSTPDVSRACFVAHDPDAFIHPKYFNDEPIFYSSQAIISV